MLHSMRSPFAVLAIAAVTLPTLSAQCAPFWAPGSPLRGANGPIRAHTWWDPDGAGPLPAKLVLVGEFTAIADTAARRVAAYDPQTGQWSELGGGIGGAVTNVVAAPNGDLVVVGRFTTAGGSPANRIARYHGGAWLPLGSGITTAVDMFAVAAMPNGDIIAGGDFQAAGGQPASHIARWNGTTWSPLGSGMTAFVSSLLPLPNGDLIAGGIFTGSGGVLTNRVARWNGTVWSALGTGVSGPIGWVSVDHLRLAPNGDLLAAGSFTTAGNTSAASIARWNGTAWSSLGSGTPGIVGSLTTLSNGDLLVSTYPALGTPSPTELLRWNGSNWTIAAPALPQPASTIAELPSGEWWVCGSFTDITGVPVSHLARWNGQTYLPLRSGFDNEVSAIAELPNGDLVVGGRFTRAPGIFANGIARWNGTAWQALGTGFTFNGGVAEVHALLALPSGDVIAGGFFTTAGGTPTQAIARWDGNAWSPMGSLVGTVYDLALAPGGDVIAAGLILSADGQPAGGIARWNGTTWSTLGAGLGPSAIVFSVLVRQNGDLVAGGAFLASQGAPSNHIARWNGTDWHALGSGLGNSVDALAELPQGDLVASGAFSLPSPRVARWNGSAWQPMGTGFPGSNPRAYSLAVLPNGDLLAGGNLPGANQNLARWNGTSWTPFAGGTLGDVYAMLPRRDGGLLLGGQLSVVGESATTRIAAGRLAALLPTCPASATTLGTGCSGPGGLATLTVETLAWLGSTLRTRASGLSAPAFVIAVYGAQATNVPLASLLPQASAGCTLRVAPDLLQLVVPTAASAALALPIPATPALIGTELLHQAIAFKTNSSGIANVTSSNALSLHIGAF